MKKLALVAISSISILTSMTTSSQAQSSMSSWDTMSRKASHGASNPQNIARAARKACLKAQNADTGALIAASPIGRNGFYTVCDFKLVSFRVNPWGKVVVGVR